MLIKTKAMKMKGMKKAKKFSRMPKDAMMMLPKDINSYMNKMKGFKP